MQSVAQHIEYLDGAADNLVNFIFEQKFLIGVHWRLFAVAVHGAFPTHSPVNSKSSNRIGVPEMGLPQIEARPARGGVFSSSVIVHSFGSVSDCCQALPSIFHAGPSVCRICS